LGMGRAALRRPSAGAHHTLGEALAAPPLPPLGTANHDLHDDQPDVRARLALIEPGDNYESIPDGHPLAVKGLISHVYRRLHPDQPAYTIVADGGCSTIGYHHIQPHTFSNPQPTHTHNTPHNSH